MRIYENSSQLRYHKTFTNIGNFEPVWIRFSYERLPDYCYDVELWSIITENARHRKETAREYPMTNFHTRLGYEQAIKTRKEHPLSSGRRKKHHQRHDALRGLNLPETTTPTHTFRSTLLFTVRS